MITRRDIPLKKAMLLWRPAWVCKGGEKPDAALVEHCSGECRCEPFNRLPMSAGACYSYWDDFDATRRLLQLYIEMIHLIYRDRVPVEKVMEACYCIPEFRETLSDDTISMLRDGMRGGNA